MSSSLQKMRESMKMSKSSMFKSSSGKQVEALREVVSQVGAQKVLHEQQAEMWKQKHAAMEKLVDHLEVLVSNKQNQIHDKAQAETKAASPSSIHGGKEQQRHYAPSSEALRRIEFNRRSYCTGNADPDHVPSGGRGEHDVEASMSGAENSVARAGTEQNFFEYVVLLGAREQDVHDALRLGGFGQLQQGVLQLECQKMACFPEEPTVGVNAYKQKKAIHVWIYIYIYSICICISICIRTCVCPSICKDTYIYTYM